MASPPPPARWDERCQNAGLNYQTIYGNYKYCAHCYAINPNPPIGSVTRQSTVGPSQRSHSIIPIDTTTLDSDSGTIITSSQPLIPTRKSVPAQRFGLLPDRAEAIRQQGFKNKQPPSRNAGSRALSHRQANTKVEQQAALPRFAVQLQVYLSEVELPAPDDALGSLLIRQNVKVHGELCLNY